LTLNPAVLRSWYIDAEASCGAFAPEQHAYLEFHRREIFARHGGGRRGSSAVDRIETGGVPAADSASVAAVGIAPEIIEPAVIEPADIHPGDVEPGDIETLDVDRHMEDEMDSADLKPTRHQRA
jgi:hypothetical protein